MILVPSWNDKNSTHEYTCHRRSQGCTSKVVRQLLINVFKHGYITGFIYNQILLLSMGEEVSISYWFSWPCFY
jgi:hypothetical protein